MKVIITGASKGIGSGIAAVLARKGYHVGLTARSQDLLKQMQDQIASDGGRCHIAACDLRDPDQVQAAFSKLIEQMNGVDALINNAGLVIRKDVFTLSLDEWRAMVETNINGVFYAVRVVLPFMKRQGGGHIINISSISGRLPLPGGSGYAATKYAVTGFSESLMQEVRDYGIKVTTIFPGSVDSESHRHDPDENHSWKIKPEEVGVACHEVLNTAPGALISQLEIRPLHRPPQKK